MATAKTRKGVTLRTAEELGQDLRLPAANTAEMEFRSKLTVALAKIIQVGRLTPCGSGQARWNIKTPSNRHCAWQYARCFDGCTDPSPCCNGLSHGTLPEEDGSATRCIWVTGDVSPVV